MSRLRIVIGNDVSDRLTVERLDDGLVRELVFFDADQLREAYDELDRQWVELAGGSSDWLMTYRVFRDAIETGDVVALRSQLVDGFVSVDHRPLGLGTRLLDDFLETYRPDDDGTTVFRSFELVNPIEVDVAGALLHVRFTGADNSTLDGLSVTRRRFGQMRSPGPVPTRPPRRCSALLRRAHESELDLGRTHDLERRVASVRRSVGRCCE